MKPKEYKVNEDKVLSNACDSDDWQNDPTEQRFYEDGNYIQMCVEDQKDDFTSEEEDGEIDDSELEELSNSEQETSASESEVVDTDNGSEHQLTPCKRKKKKKSKSQRRMEAKIDSLTDALAAVQNLIVNKGDTTTSGKASFVKQISNKEAMWLYAELFVGMC